MRYLHFRTAKPPRFCSRSRFSMPPGLAFPAITTWDSCNLEDRGEPAWIGNCNELNASYATDAYARINGLGAMIVTHGVGTFSAVNGIAGAYSEHVPVILISGSLPLRAVQRGEQELSTVMRHDLKPFIFVINNSRRRCTWHPYPERPSRLCIPDYGVPGPQAAENAQIPFPTPHGERNADAPAEGKPVLV